MGVNMVNPKARAGSLHTRYAIHSRLSELKENPPTGPNWRPAAGDLPESFYILLYQKQHSAVRHLKRGDLS